MTRLLREVIIPKEAAVFRLDKQGRWCNQHGPFEHKKISDYFHRCIRLDKSGYCVCQERNNIKEKVYFHYEDTVFFVFDIEKRDPVRLILNTGRRIKLRPDKLWVKEDQLYMLWGRQTVKFAERALLKMSDLLEFEGASYFIRLAGKQYRVAAEEISR